MMPKVVRSRVARAGGSASSVAFGPEVVHVTLERAAAKGSRLAGALAEAATEELAAATGGPRPAHARMRGLGYVGLSEQLSHRPGHSAHAQPEPPISPGIGLSRAGASKMRRVAEGG